MPVAFESFDHPPDERIGSEQQGRGDLILPIGFPIAECGHLLKLPPISSAQTPDTVLIKNVVDGIGSHPARIFGLA